LLFARHIGREGVCFQRLILGLSLQIPLYTHQHLFRSNTQLFLLEKKLSLIFKLENTEFIWDTVDVNWIEIGQQNHLYHSFDLK
jgi:hypothetical protein